ncbi:MAG: diguanylate cyclase, partial [Actinobacteria bacterium]|nr:diguanylate cyclase [Actinomycetota bacterium]
MFSVKFTCVVAAFVISLSAVVWMAIGDERRAAERTFDEIEAADGMNAAVLARESALRGFAQTRRMSFLEPYDESMDALADASDRASDLSGGDVGRLAAIATQDQLAERWAASANDAIIRIRNGRPVSYESALARSALIARFSEANDELRTLIRARGDAAHRTALMRVVLLIVLLSAAFATASVLIARGVRRRDAERRDVAERYYTSQREFAETLQVTSSEVEAHALVKRHLERSLPQTQVAVLNRNNSQNRLEATTPLPDTSPIARALADASPGSCVAIRLGRTHARSDAAEPLLACSICSDLPRSTCVPSLVGGEVIGSVLVSHDEALDRSHLNRIEESVGQAAPVLANLRNLAVAEIRASTDVLTGLPNTRALRESLIRMLAQAARSELPFSAVLCDLDHFKQINDVYGHDRGDEALASCSAALRAGLRASDLAGRYGG